MNLFLFINKRKKITVFFFIALMFCYNLCGSTVFAAYSDLSNTANAHSSHDSHSGHKGHGSNIDSCDSHQLSFEKSDKISKVILSSVTGFLILQEQNDFHDIFTSGKNYDLLFQSIPYLTSITSPIHDRAPPITTISI